MTDTSQSDKGEWRGNKALLTFPNVISAAIGAAYCEGLGYRIKWCGPNALHLDCKITGKTRRAIVSAVVRHEFRLDALGPALIEQLEREKEDLLEALEDISMLANREGQIIPCAEEEQKDIAEDLLNILKIATSEITPTTPRKG